MGDGAAEPRNCIETGWGIPQAGGREDSTATSPGLDLQTLELALKPLQEALEALRSLEVSRAEGRPLQVAALSQDELQAGPVDAALLSAAQDGLIRQLEENQDKLQRALVEFQSSLNRQLDRAAARVEAALERSDQLGRELSGTIPAVGCWVLSHDLFPPFTKL